MRKETKVMSLVIVLVLSLCLSVAASPIAATAAPQSKVGTGVEKDATVRQANYNLTLTCDPSSVNVNQTFKASGSLYADGSGVSGASINVQYKWSDNGTWTLLTTTNTNDSGNYGVSLTPHVAGQLYLEAVYHDSNGNPTVSNEVEVTVSS
jgi:hypothetical protein